MEIAITGAHRVGKSVLAEKLHEHLPDYDLHNEPYHEMEASGYLFPEIPGVDDFLEQLTFSINQLSESGENAIFDRCPIDMLAYIHALDPNRDIEQLFRTVQEVIAETDLLVFVPVEEPDIIGCQRSDLPGLRKRVNGILSEWVQDLDVDTIEVHGGVPARVKQILERTCSERNKKL